LLREELSNGISDDTEEDSGYSFMEHLAKSILFSRYRSDALMVIFSAYFDASGHPDQSDVLTVAGYAAAVDSWIRFDKEWQGILEPEGVTSFHMTDFVSGKGEFTSWKGKEPEKVERRRHFVEQLTCCLQRNYAKFFRASLFIPDYERVNQEFMLAESIGLPYATCCCLVTFAVREWASDLGALDTLLYFFEDGDKDKGNFEEMHRAIYRKNPKFLDKTEAIAFQAADLNAWKMRTALHECNKPTHTLEIGNNLLRSISLLNGVQKEGGVLNELSFRSHCKRMGIAKK
jgi:hypothetical protein